MIRFGCSEPVEEAAGSKVVDGLSPLSLDARAFAGLVVEGYACCGAAARPCAGNLARPKPAVCLA